MYRYKATVVSVFDGDTIRLKLKLGFGIEDHGPKGKGRSFRLYGIDTPEIRGESRDLGLAARDYVREVLPVGKEVEIQSFVTDSIVCPFLIKVYVPEESGEFYDLNQGLVNLGHAIISDYAKE